VTTTDLATTDNASRVFTDQALSNIDGFEAAMAALEDAGVGYESISDYGTGFTVIDKERLVGVPFVALEWRFNASDMSEAGFVSVAVVTKHGEKFVINDGSTGIREQLQNITALRATRNHKTPQAGLLVPGGLTVSSYTYTDDKGKQIPARTYYLDDRPTVKS
jgi:hypothetical protein